MNQVASAIAAAMADRQPARVYVSQNSGTGLEGDDEDVTRLSGISLSSSPDLDFSNISYFTLCIRETHSRTEHANRLTICCRRGRVARVRRTRGMSERRLTGVRTHVASTYAYSFALTGPAKSV